MSNVNDFAEELKTAIYERMFEHIAENMDGNPAIMLPESIIKDAYELTTLSASFTSDKEHSLVQLTNIFGIALGEEIIDLKHDGNYIFYYLNIDEVSIASLPTDETKYELHVSFIVLPKDDAKVELTNS